ncbi:MAG: hypothetical protein JO057_17925 [Chloroflexi bacterium]|nr:hypothetical protein [Chloroflexota bacterium]
MKALSVETFAPLVGSLFRMHVDPEQTWDVELIEARSIEAPALAARQPFSLVFRGPRTPLAVQRIYRLEHAALGELELFLVPVGPDKLGMCYEAIFS